MSEERETKRVRQACQNCRRKKTRCSGEKPTCAFCARLKQECCYEPGPGSDASNPTDMTLAARVALLESKLSLLDSASLDFGISTHEVPSNDGTRNLDRHLVFSALDSPKTRRGSEADVLPPLSIVLALIDAYFRYCHCQPYCYFEEAFFRRKLQDGKVPSYLLKAVLAMAAHFSQDPFLDGNQQDMIDLYSRSAWDEIFEKSFSEDDTLDITVIQAINMLAVVDFTTGKHKLAWVKIGLSVRFAQSLHLTMDPPTELTLEEQEERVLTFWSVYLLDRLVSCGTTRPPTILDSDCSVRLPTDCTKVGAELRSSQLTLQTLQDLTDSAMPQNLSQFAHTILMASVLGKVERFSLQKHISGGQYKLWHNRGEYCKIYSLLLDFETYSDAILVPFPEALDRWCWTGDAIDQRRVGHFVFSTILYHLNHCLLHHPFLLRNHVKGCKTRIPSSFLKQALFQGLEHASLLTSALRVVQQRNMSLASFYAYACTAAATIHKLYTFHEDERVANNSKVLFECSVLFLLHGQDVWRHYSRMAYALMQLDPDPALARWLVTAASEPSLDGTFADASMDFMWDLLDYGWLCDSARPSSSPEACDKTHNVGQGEPTFSSLDLDQGMSTVDNFMPKSSALPIDLDYFDPTVTDPTFGTWVDVIESGLTRESAE
ncbi:hypothetical protein PV08_06560 [Exophiala spinifera]|uniref:Zn(2)-C6 fungal-type domain-containing protein n=1 Tax=Exophiala spinifera TaxID=91928 RepID=A0A0D2BD50_9EURO|nr:uncharacterized protein PV08_06560 [Exophiala spinifera]KIW16505.1 hypothetical protein PV08_06560 [Exophiala spinifera]